MQNSQTVEFEDRANKEPQRQPIIALSWETIHHAVDALQYEIERTRPDLDFIVAIARGGLIPATLLSHKLNLPMKIVTAQSYEGTRRTPNKPTEIVGWDRNWEDKKILIVDDILDSGATKKAIDDFRTTYLKSYAMIVNKRPFTSPTAHFITVDPSVWIKFPWES